MNKLKNVILTVGLMVLAFTTYAQEQIKPILELDNLREVNRRVSLAKDTKRGNVVNVKGQADPGIVWVKGLSFTQGVIAFEVKGKDVLQQSFVGIAFHGIDDQTYEAVYFRPFNFLATDTVRKKHAIQYMALPKYDWPYLRKTFPDKYEAGIGGEIDPNDWFKVRLEVQHGQIKVFVNQNEKPALVVQSLTPEITGKKVGFWTGNNSDGNFANLLIRAAK